MDNSERQKPLHAGHRQRLRERFLKSGINGFHDYEVLELALTYAIPRQDVKPLAKRLIARFNGLRGVLDAAHYELVNVEGVGHSAAVLIRLLKETAEAYLKEQIVKNKVINSASDVIDFLSLKLSGEKVERFMAIYLSSKNEVMGIEVLHEGTLNQTAVYPRKALEGAFRHNARSIIFVHNHPSGDSMPSKADLKLTKELETAATAVDILVHDHIIIGKNSYHSIRDNGWI
ncbi:MAG: DNA repair protein RadC [Deltaproteobacteria bacterium]|nr:DNA repair protein RadC [Deltaproteobacteria bacterium]